jgi:hypothetical protein
MYPLWGRFGAKVGLRRSVTEQPGKAAFWHFDPNAALLRRVEP